ncbi:MAG TPA: hypothetical protein VK059_02635, partial [Nocardioidaceae bacterium]|nr:hypothetical protein [Nocardioidaceae bacterium]
MLQTSTPRSMVNAAGITIPLAVAGLAIALGQVVSLVSPLLIALIIGAVMGNSALGDHALMRGQ